MNFATSNERILQRVTSDFTTNNKERATSEKLRLITIAPRVILIDHLLKTFNFAKKEAPRSEKKTSYFCSSKMQHYH